MLAVHTALSSPATHSSSATSSPKKPHEEDTPIRKAPPKKFRSRSSPPRPAVLARPRGGHTGSSHSGPRARPAHPHSGSGRRGRPLKAENTQLCRLLSQTVEGGDGGECGIQTNPECHQHHRSSAGAAARCPARPTCPRRRLLSPWQPRPRSPPHHAPSRRT